VLPAEVGRRRLEVAEFLLMAVMKIKNSSGPHHHSCGLAETLEQPTVLGAMLAGSGTSTEDGERAEPTG
jgi:hypothetical protein